MLAAAERLRGAQTPRIRVTPPAQTSAGRECIELARSVGLILDPWQELVLHDALGESSGRWTSFEVGLIVSRQNGKGGVLEARQLAGLFLFGERLQIHTAHQFRTTQEHFRRVRDLIDGSDDLRRRVDRIRTADGEEAIELKSRQRLRFVARSGASGRGFSGDVTYLDEAMILDDDAIGALLPTMSARPNPQLWYTGSAGNQKTNSVVLGRVRRRALAKLVDPSLDPRLTFQEYSAPDGTPPNRFSERELWALANPAYEIGRADGSGLREEFILSELAAMDPAVFGCERLGIGYWPSLDGKRWAVIAEPAWRARGGLESERPTGEVAFGIAAAWPDADSASIAVSGSVDGDTSVQLVDRRPGTSWVVARAVELDKAHDNVGFVVDEGGPAGHLVEPLHDAGLTVLTPAMREVAHASKEFLAGLGAVEGNEPYLRHYDQDDLDDAAAAADRRTLGDGWTWQRREDDISPLEAATLATWGYRKYGGAEPWAMWG